MEPVAGATGSFCMWKGFYRAGEDGLKELLSSVWRVQGAKEQAGTREQAAMACLMETGGYREQKSKPAPGNAGN